MTGMDEFFRAWGAGEQITARRDARAEQDRMAELSRMIGGDLASGNFQGAANQAFGAGQLDTGMDLLGMMQQQQNTQREQMMAMMPHLYSAAEHLRSLPEADRPAALASLSQRLAAVGVPVDQIDDDLSDAALDRELAELQALGFGQDEASIEPIEINGQLVDPRTYEVLGDYRDPDDRVSSAARAAAAASSNGRRYEYRVAAEGDPNWPVGATIEVNTETGQERIVNEPEDSDDTRSRQTGDMVARQQEVVDLLDEIADRANWSNTGFVGGVTGFVPSSPASNLGALIDTVEANVAFDELQRMRQNSPTGGALGSVSERELTLLSSALGSMRQSQSTDQFRESVRRVQRQYQRAIQALQADLSADGGAPAPTSAPAPPDNDPLGIRGE